MIKMFFSFRFKYRILLFLQQFKPLHFFKNVNVEASKNQAYIFLAADYGNLGDVAITYAQTKFLQEHSKYQVIEIPISKSLEGLWFVKRHIKKGDLITTVGGGNLGDMYDQIEYIRQLVVTFFPNNKMISFPQTFDFAETISGAKALNSAQKVYNKHKDIHFVAREQTSYALMKKYFNKTQVYLTPDIVISLNKSQPEKKRKGVVICMRKDKEKKLSEHQSDFVLKQIKDRFKHISYYDTHINQNNLIIQQRDSELNKIWDAFRGAELVVTDRLHGMIFCYITNTPCLVFQNNNHKVRETYDWIKGNANINLVKEFSEEHIITFFKKDSYSNGDLIEIDDKYNPIKHLIN